MLTSLTLNLLHLLLFLILLLLLLLLLQRESFDGCNDKIEVCSSREFTRSFVRIIQDRAYSFNGALPSGCIQQRRRSWKLSFRAVRRRKRGRHCSRAVRRGAEIGTCTRGVCIWFHGSCILSSITHLRIVIVIIHARGR